MFNILIPFFAPLTAGIGFLAIRALTGLGIGVVSYSAVGLVLQQLLTLAQGHYNNIPAFALQIAGLSGIGQALGMIAGAITFRATFMLMSKLGVIPK